jgi:WD40 repeat protein
VGRPDGTVQVLALPSGAVELTLTGHSAPVARLVWSADGTRLATAPETSADPSARLWDASSGKLLATLAGMAPVRTLRFSPDGARLAVAHGAAVTLAAAADGAVVATFADHGGDVKDVAWDARGARLATASNDGTAVIRDAASGAPLVTLRGHTNAVTAVAFDPASGRVATASWDKRVGLWDAGTGEQKAWIEDVAARDLAWSADGTRLLAVGVDKAALLDASGKLVAKLGNEGFVTAAAWSARDRLVLAARDGSLRVYARDGRLVARLDGHVGPVAGVSPAHAGHVAASWGPDGTAKVWDVRPAGVVVDDIGPAKEALFNRSGSLVTVFGPDVLDDWDTSSGSLQFAHPAGASPDGAYPFIDGAMSAQVTMLGLEKANWDLQTGVLVPLAVGRLLDDEGDSVALASSDGRALDQVIDRKTGRVLVDLQRPLRDMTAVERSPDHSRLVCVNRFTEVAVIDASMGAELATFSTTQPLAGVRFTADGRSLVAYGDSPDVELFDAATGRPEGVFRGHEGPVRSAALSADGHFLLTGSVDGSARLWSVSRQELLAVLRPGTGPVGLVALDAHARHAFAGGVLYELAREDGAADEVAERLDRRGTYRLSAGRLVPAVPTTMGSRRLPPAPPVAALRPQCPAGLVAHGALFPLERAAWCTTTDGLLSGPRTLWSAAGAVLATQTYLDGQPTGTWIERDPHGVVRRVSDFPAPVSPPAYPGASHERFYRESGQLQDDSYWRFNFWRVGTRTLYHANGQKSYEWVYGECPTPRTCGRRAQVTSWDSKGRKTSEGPRLAVDPWRSVPFGEWHFLDGGGQTVTFDFGPAPARHRFQPQ